MSKMINTITASSAATQTQSGRPMYELGMATELDDGAGVAVGNGSGSGIVGAGTGSSVGSGESEMAAITPLSKPTADPGSC